MNRLDQVDSGFGSHTGGSSMDSLRDKVFIITGAGGTIASAVGQSFLNAGARLVLVDVDGVRIEGLGKSFASPAIEADLRTAAGAQHMLGEIKEHVGRIDGLIHLVGEVITGPIAEMDEGAYELTFDTNVRSLFNAVKVVLPELLQGGQGFIGGIASREAWQGGEAGASLFAAAKSAVEAFLRSLDKELADTAVDVAIVFPMGPVDTVTNRRQFRNTQQDALITPQAIGEALVYAARWQHGGRLLEIPIHPPRSALR
jgi:NADP-dependent 3-hydroxy acid dehydrogenase YdfG